MNLFRYIALMASLVTVLPRCTADTDWPQWRGPANNGVSTEVGLIDRFDPKGGDGSNVLWKSELAAGISTPIVMNGRIYTIVRDSAGTPKDREKVICLEADSGKLLWENIYNVFLTDIPAERVGWSHVCGDRATGNVYVNGACCFFQCIDGATGQTVWSRSLSEEFGMLSTYGGRTNTPIVFENLVIISGVTTGWDDNARPAHRFFAFGKSDGRLVWTTSTNPLPEDTTYSTPVITLLDGKHVMVAGSGDGNAYGFEPRTGRILWQQPISRRGVNTSPVIDPRGRIFIGHGEENPEGTAMGAVVCLDGKAASTQSESSRSKSAELWRTEGLMVGKSSPLLLGGRLYVVEDSSALHVLDPDTGEEIGSRVKLGTTMRGSLVAADGKIYAATGTGIVHVLQPTDEGTESLFKIRLPSGHDIGGSPAIANGRIFLPTTGGLFCLGDPASERPLQSDATRSADQASLTRQESSAEMSLAYLQVIPAEALVRSGETIRFEVVGFDSNGRRLKDQPTDFQFQVSGGGEIDSQGVFTAPQSASHLAAVVTVTSAAKATGSLRQTNADEGNPKPIIGTASLRIVPPLPWKFDFSDQQVPVTWIGARYRHEARLIDSEPMIVKISTIPKGTRSQSWFGPTDLHDYTVTADVCAGTGDNTAVSAKLPDMGVIAQRYTLDLMGESQQLQIRSWAAQLRMAKSTQFQWSAGDWYTLKLRVANRGDGTALVQGKVWQRGTDEPNAWLVEAIDTSPNANGSPGLFGNSTNAEIFIDNVTVTRNE
tara:strand:- start:830267 stop:832576 length:2310 start_codon:yes stop_codon:yes gene_type:complete